MFSFLSKLHLTPPQLAIWHIIESVLMSFVLTVLLGTYQYITTHGLDYAGLGTFWATSFLGALAMIYKSVSGNPNLGPAILDSLNEIKGLLASAPAQPPVVINNHPPVPVAPPAAAQPTIPQFKNTASSVPEFTAPLSTVTPPRVQ